MPTTSDSSFRSWIDEKHEHYENVVDKYTL